MSIWKCFFLLKPHPKRRKRKKYNKNYSLTRIYIYTIINFASVFLNEFEHTGEALQLVVSHKHAHMYYNLHLNTCVGNNKLHAPDLEVLSVCYRKDLNSRNNLNQSPKFSAKPLRRNSISRSLKAHLRFSKGNQTRERETDRGEDDSTSKK